MASSLLLHWARSQEKSLQRLWDCNAFLIMKSRGSKFLYHSYCDLLFGTKIIENDGDPD